MKIMAIAWNTFRESIRDRILYNLLIFALLLIVSTVALQELTVATQQRVMVDLGLASISVFGTLMAIFLGIGLVYKEIDRRTIYTIVSKPIARHWFIVGKFIGQMITLAVNLAVMAIMLEAVIFATLHLVDLAPVWAVAFLFLELMVLTSIAMLFSSFTTPTLSAIFTLSFWVMGHLVADMRNFAAHSAKAKVINTFAALTRTIPDLDRFNFKTLATYGEKMDPQTALYTILLGLFYTVFFLALAALIFQRRDFK